MENNCLKNMITVEKMGDEEMEPSITLVKMVTYEENKYKDFEELVEKYDDSCLWEQAEELVKRCIFRNMYRYDGNYHQYGKYGCFLFEDSDGEQYVWMVSMRRFGAIMAEVWSMIDNKTSYDYMDFYMMPGDDQTIKTPSSETEFASAYSTESYANCEICNETVPFESLRYGVCQKCVAKMREKFYRNRDKIDEE